MNDGANERDIRAYEAAYASTYDFESVQVRFRREAVRLPAVVRGGKLHDAITVDDIGPGGMVCSDAPYAELDNTVKIVIDDVKLGLTYHFKTHIQ